MAEYIEREALLSAAEGYDWMAGLKTVLKRIPAADVRPVVLCKDCKWWTKQEASLQGRCELLQMYPTGTWFCANGNPNREMEESS